MHSFSLKTIPYRASWISFLTVKESCRISWTVFNRLKMIWWVQWAACSCSGKMSDADKDVAHEYHLVSSLTWLQFLLEFAISSSGIWTPHVPKLKEILRHIALEWGGVAVLLFLVFWEQRVVLCAAVTETDKRFWFACEIYYCKLFLRSCLYYEINVIFNKLSVSWKAVWLHTVSCRSSGGSWGILVFRWSASVQPK